MCLRTTINECKQTCRSEIVPLELPTDYNRKKCTAINSSNARPINSVWSRSPSRCKFKRRAPWRGRIGLSGCCPWFQAESVQRGERFDTSCSVHGGRLTQYPLLRFISGCGVHGGRTPGRTPLLRFVSGCVFSVNIRPYVDPMLLLGAANPVGSVALLPHTHIHCASWAVANREHDRKILDPWLVPSLEVEIFTLADTVGIASRLHGKKTWMRDWRLSRES